MDKSAGKNEGEYLEELITNHVSGRVKSSSEHTSPHVLSSMRKVPFELFRNLKNVLIISGLRMILNMSWFHISSQPIRDVRMPTWRTLRQRWKVWHKTREVQDFYHRLLWRCQPWCIIQELIHIQAKGFCGQEYRRKTEAKGIFLLVYDKNPRTINRKVH